MPDPRPGVTITKIDAARRQLETAILLYFRDVDAVSVHTLAAAAHEIVSAINRKNAGPEPMISEWVLEQIKPEYRQEISDQLKEAQNFFKHGSRDPLSTLEAFTPEQSELLLIDACMAYRRITAEATPPMRLFALWARFNFAKDWLSYPGESEEIGNDPAMAARLATMPKGSYFDLMLPLVYSARHFQLPSAT